MPNNDDYLSRQLSAVNNAFGVQAVGDQPVTEQSHVDNINWKVRVCFTLISCVDDGPKAKIKNYSDDTHGRIIV